MKKTRITALAAFSAITLAISACGGSSSSTAVTPNQQVTGTVTAPGGQLAFNKPTAMDSFFASIFGSDAHAAITGVVAVGAGVTVELIEVDAAGAQVGASLASATTAADGSFSIEAPAGFTADPKYVIRAAGTSGELDARVTDLATNIDPVSDATSDLVTINVTDLSLLTTGEIDEIGDAVDTLTQNVDPTGLDSETLASALNTEATADEELNNIVSSSISGGQVCGNISDSTGAVLENIRIVVRDFGNWVTRAKTKTDANGDYCVNVPVAGSADPFIPGLFLSGNYIMGAINRTGTSMAATQWWTSTSTTANGSGGANNQFNAGMFSVPDTTTITHNMVLDANGARIQGTVTATVGSTPIEGLGVIIRNYDTFKPLSSAKTKADGTYRINVKPADYLISFRNKTNQPFASEVRGVIGGVVQPVVDRNKANRETLAGGTTYTFDADLDAGVVIKGTVTDATVAVPGTVVDINNTDGGRAEKLRTNKLGKFRMWVNPRLGGPATPYTVRTRGQSINADTNGGDDNTATNISGLAFAADVTTITGKIVSNDGMATPVGQAVVFLKNSPGYSTESQVVSNSDGTFTLYTDTAGDYIVTMRMDNDPAYGSGVFSGTAFDETAWGAATVVTATAPPSTMALNGGGNITIPTLGQGTGVGFLTGNVGAGATGVAICLADTNCGGTQTDRFTSTKSRGDGSFKVGLPGTTAYPSVRSGFNCTTVGTIADAATKNVVITPNPGGSCVVTP